MTINEWSDVTAMAEAVQNKMVSPRELVKDTISEAERTNTKINAIVSQRYEKALVEAEKFFAIMEEVYLYTGSHQISTINLEKTKDYLRGITQSLHLSSIHQLAGLHRETVERLEKEACYYAEKYLYDGDQELLYLLLDANAAINRELIGINDTYVLSAVISMWNAANKYMTLRNVKLIKIIKKLLYIKK